MAFEIVKSFILSPVYIGFGYEVSYAACSRTAKMVNICIFRVVAVDRLTSAISIGSKL